MKYIISLCLIVFALSLSNAQISVNMTGTDTVVNTGSVDLTFPVTQAYNTGAYQIVVTKVSGTVAGNVILQGSVNGTNYVPIDTFVATNVAIQTHIFTENPVKYPFYRVNYTGTGTMAAIISGRAHFKGRL